MMTTYDHQPAPPVIDDKLVGPNATCYERGCPKCGADLWMEHVPREPGDGPETILYFGCSKPDCVCEGFLTIAYSVVRKMCPRPGAGLEEVQQASAIAAHVGRWILDSVANAKFAPDIGKHIPTALERARRLLTTSPSV